VHYRSASAANQLLAYSGYSRHAAGVCANYDASPLYDYSNNLSTPYRTEPQLTPPAYSRQCDYPASLLYSADCVNQSPALKSRRRVTSSMSSSLPTNHGADTCYYKKQRLVGSTGYPYDATTASSPSAAVADAAGYTNAFDVVSHT